jgi:CheY-like chemotaxis protein
MRLDVQLVDLPVVIKLAIDSMQPAADAKGVRIQSVLDPLTEPVYGDPARLQQVVWNLLSNAVKFTPRGGRVQLVLRRVDSHATITVSDTGEGIESDFVPHVFERFRQADASASRRHGGLGIGLALVKLFVELHGGKVRAASEGQGKGATFVIDLPLAAVQGQSDSPPLPPTPAAALALEYQPIDLRGVTVLLVDDEQDSLEMVRRVLEDCRAVIVTATSAEEALRCLDTRTFHLIISDIGMPHRDGYQLLMDVRSRGIKTPAVALTAFARAEDRTRAMLVGYQTHMAKPVEPVELLATVASVTGRAPELE